MGGLLIKLFCFLLTISLFCSESPRLSTALPMQHIGTNDIHFAPRMTYKAAGGKPFLQVTNSLIFLTV